MSLRGVWNDVDDTFALSPRDHEGPIRIGLETCVRSLPWRLRIIETHAMSLRIVGGYLSPVINSFL
jgi:hypothetical protein